MNRIRAALLLTLTTALLAADPSVEQARKQLADKKYDEAIASLDTAFKKNPKSVDVKAGLIEAYLAKGDSLMNDPAMPPRVKYPGALKSYRQVLTYEKTNKKALDNIATIEGIYKSMGRPIPQ